MKAKNIVTIGGGTGSFTLLSGLKKYPVNISAIVSMADDGGSTGVLRDELGVLPPGDVRQCLVALSESSDTFRELMGYRFEKGGLRGHNFGNLLLSALEKISGSFSEGIQEAVKILNVKGEVIPVSEKDMRLCIELKNGKILEGEKELDHNEEIRQIGIEKVFLKRSVPASKKAISLIRKADFIIIGPGDLYGSLLPNFLVKDLSLAVRRSKAKVIFNCGLTNKKGQTENFSVDDYVLALEKYLGRGRIDFVTANCREPEEKLIRKYEKREGKNALVKFDKGKKRNYRIVCADLLQRNISPGTKGDPIGHSRSFIRHDGEKLAKLIMVLTELGEYENIIKDII
jgi:uncharacterized cofD-like protein